MPGSAEQGVHRIAFHALQEVPAEQALRFHVPNFGLDGGASPEVSFQQSGHEGAFAGAGELDEHDQSVVVYPS